MLSSQDYILSSPQNPTEICLPQNFFVLGEAKIHYTNKACLNVVFYFAVALRGHAGGSEGGAPFPTQPG